jgi:signal recognition particle receptor subunit beta
MAEMNEDRKKLTVKIVYYGPALSGKTTNLIQLHDAVNPGGRGELMSLETKGDRTLFFDLLPLVVKAGRLNVIFKLFTVPGQVSHNATRKAVLSRADGVVFVADSHVNQAMNNAESFENLETNSRQVGLDMDRLPLVVQFNKRDLPDIDSEETIRKLWGPTGISLVFASAVRGEGVVETFRAILGRCYRSLDEEYNLSENFGIEESDFLRVV